MNVSHRLVMAVTGDRQAGVLEALEFVYVAVVHNGVDGVAGSGQFVLIGSGLLLVGLCGLAADRNLAALVSELADSVERLTNGDSDVELPTDRDGEIGRLSEALAEFTRQAHQGERERELERYREYTDDILDAIDDVFYVFDEQGTLLRWNEALPEATGYTSEEIDEMSPLDFFAEDEQDRIAAAIATAFETGGARVESELLRKDGSRIPYEFVAASVDDPDGEAVLTGIGRDITERKTHEQELRERERELTTLMGNIPGMVYRARNEPDWPFEFVSEGCRAVTGYEPDDLETGTVNWANEVIVGDNDELWETVQWALENREPYRVTFQIETADGETRWVWEQGRGVFDDDGTLEALEGVILDITERKERELALESLQETTRGLLGTETNTQVAQLVVESAKKALTVPGVAVYLLDEETNRLEPAAFTDSFADVCGDPESVPIDQGDSVLWNSFVSGTQTIIDDGSPESTRFLSPAVGGGMVVPMDDYGVFVLAAPEPAVDDETRRLVETLVATTEAALDRLKSEAILRERESELASRNQRLRRQIKINRIIRSVHQSLIGADSRAEIERTVCEHLVAAENIEFAWIGALDPGGDEIEIRAWDGNGHAYLDELPLTVAGGSEPALVTARSGESTVVSNVVEGHGEDDWRKRAMLHGFHSVVSVPISFEEFSFCVLTVYADEPGTFSELERTVFTELGESIANSIVDVNTRKALHDDTLVELTLRLSDDSFFTRIARETDCQLEYEGLASHDTDESRLFFTAAGTAAETILTALDSLVSVTDAGVVSSVDDRHLFEATVAGDTLPSQLVRHGGNPHSIRTVETGLEVVVDVPRTTDVREFVGMLEEDYVDVELRGRRDVERSVQTKQEFHESLLDDLTERQLEVLKTAYYSGFFEWPRTSTGQDIATMLDVTQPTVNRHLRLAQQRLLEGLFDDVVTLGENGEKR